MKTILILRHADSDPAQGDMSDHDRPINHQGRQDAILMGRLLADDDLLPERILSSTARRARQTAVLVAEACGYVGEIDYLPDLYKCTPDHYADALRSLPDSVTRAMLVGHNPELEDYVSALAGGPKDVPKGGSAHFVVPIDSWSALMPFTTVGMANLWRPHEVAHHLAEVDPLP